MIKASVIYENVEKINDYKFISDVLRKHVNEYFIVLEEKEHYWPQKGYTIIFLLSASHAIAHTYDDEKILTFDICLCRNDKETINDVYDVSRLIANDLNVKPTEYVINLMKDNYLEHW